MPTSQRKIDANRHNAKNSTGPRTPEGKAKSSMNAVTHGITARTLCLSTEHQDDLLDLMDDYFAECQPAKRMKCDLVEVLISSVWRLRRARRHETALLDIQMAVDAESVNKQFPNLDETCREALAFNALCDQSTAWQNLERYQTRLRRDWLTAQAGLRRLRDERPDDRTPPATQPRAPEDAAPSSQAGPQSLPPRDTNPPLAAAALQIEPKSTLAAAPFYFTTSSTLASLQLQPAPQSQILQIEPNSPLPATTAPGALPCPPAASIPVLPPLASVLGAFAPPRESRLDRVCNPQLPLVIASHRASKNLSPLSLRT